MKPRKILLVLISLLCGCVAATGLSRFPASPEARGAEYAGVLRAPEGGGPFPAVVLLHTCGGYGGHISEWGRKLVGAGYVVLMVDSFTPRGVRSVCGNWQVSIDEVAADAVNAGRHLRTLPFVDGNRIAVAGFSYGAMAGLRLASAGYAARFDAASPFKAVAAFYPECTGANSRNPIANNLYNDISTPLYLFLGALDSETPAVMCSGPADQLRGKGHPVRYKLYPNAGHGFDQANSSTYRFNLEAFLDSWEEMQRFFGETLR